MKQFEIKSEKKIGGNVYYIRPLPAFKCANLSGELLALIIPILTSIAPLIGGSDAASVFDMEAEAVSPHLANGLSALSGDKLEVLLKKLLTTYKNVSVQLEDDNEAQTLTDDIVNEAFCGNVQDIFILAFEVIKVNFSGFFEKLGGIEFGNRLKAILQKEA